MAWNDAHNKVWEKDARGNETSYAYDAAGNLLTRTDAVGGVTSYTYDGSGRVLTVTTNGRLVAQNTYDARGNLETATDALGRVTHYAYTADGLPDTITQPGDATTHLAYNADGTVRSITDGEGGTTELGYDEFGHLQSIRDPLLNERTLAADAAGRITSMTDASQRTTAFEYDAEGNRTAVVDPDLHRTEFGYDALNRLLTVTDAQGSATRTEYDPEGRVLARTDPLGRATHYGYDITGRLVETTDAAGNTTTQGYCADVSSQACAIVDPLGNYTEIDFDALGRPTSTRDANGVVATEHYDTFGRRDTSTRAGQETHYEYDEAGRLTRVIDALQGITAYGYDERGNRTSVTDANGHTTYFGYDRANRLVWERNPIQAVGSETRYEYDAAGNRRFKTDGNGSRTEYVYDANRRLTAVLFADGSRYDFAYDARGNRTLERSPTHERALAYDALGRLERVEDHTLGRVITYAYDVAGQRRRMTVDTGEVTQYAWDAAGRLLETIDPQGEATRFGYDAAGRRTSATYGNGTRATYSYDGAGQVLSIAYLNQSGQVQTAFGYGYDNAGNRKYKAFADGTREQYGYDALSRLTSVKYPDDREVGYGYDAVGNRRWMTDSAGAQQTRWAVSATASSSSYSTPADATGAPNSYSWGPASTQGSWLEVTFASAERASGIRVHETGGAPCVMRIDLIDEGGTSHSVFGGGDATTDGGWLVVRFAPTAYRVAKAKVYTTSGRSGYREGIDAVGLDVPASETYAYNGFNQLLSVTGADGSLTTFQYDGNGNQVSKSVRPEWVTQTTTYGYDQDNRLRQVSVPSGPAGEPTVQWAVTATASSAYGSGTGNWSASQATGAPNETACGASGRSWAPSNTTSTAPEWLQLEYATAEKAVGVKVRENRDAGSVTKVELIDEGGTSHEVWAGTDRTTCGGTLEVKFEETAYKVKAVRLTTGGVKWEEIDAVGLVSAPPPGGTLTSTYEYDANGLRTYKSDTAGETRYLLDGLSVVAQYAPDGQRQAWYTQSLARIDEVLNVVNDSGKQWYQADALGSIYALTNNSGALVARSGYDVFGSPMPPPTPGSQAGQPFGFTGREHELDSGLVYARDRYLSPVTGRWTQADRLGVTAGPNFFAYANNQVTRFGDPTGQVIPAMFVLAGIGAVYGAVFSFAGGLISGLSGVELLQHVGIGIVTGIAAMLLPVSGVATLAIVNGVMAAIGSLWQSINRRGWGEVGLEDFIGAAIAGAIAGAMTLLVGYGVRTGIAPVFEEFFTHLSSGEAAIAGISATAAPGGSLSDFLVQVLIIPAMYQVKQRMQIEAMFRERYDEEVGLCR